VAGQSQAGREWRIGPHDMAPARVSGGLAALAGYLTGRPLPGPALIADPEPPPSLPAWL
jgi:hypothetical protein